MILKPGLWQQQTIKLAMTQELTQAILLLQYSTQELTEFLENKSLENPLLQIDASNVQAMDPRAESIRKSNKKVESDKQNWIEQIGKNDTTLSQYLFSQIEYLSFTPKIKKAIHFLINSLDDNGYLNMSMDEASALLQLPSQDIEGALHIIQELEPTGVGARSLQECLLLQLKHLDERHELAETILSEHFDSFANKKWKAVSKCLNIELKDIQEVFDFIQILNPRPGSDFQSHSSPYIVPDVIMGWDGESFTVSLFDESVPKISFNDRYFRKFTAKGDDQVKRFLHEKQQDYHWILKSLEQRKETMTKVAIKIVEKQQDYFIRGPQYLKPMTMKEISDELGIHESTVSRAVREKYAQTPFGTVELKSFFSSTIKTTSNEDASSKRVKEALSKLISGEDKFKPLSDQELVGLLEQKEGIMVSRRTIAKYREQMGIASSSKRKRFG